MLIELPTQTYVKALSSVLYNATEASSSHLKNKEDNNHFQLSEQMSQVTNVPVTLDLDAYQAERRGRTTLSVEVTASSRPLDLNSEACIANNLVRNDIAEHADNCNEVPLLKKHEDKHGNKCVTSVGIGLDLNAEDDSSVNQELFRTNKDQDKSRDVSECGSTTGPVQEKDPLRMWKEMKQNGFLSSSHGGISIQSGFMSSSHGGIPMPKQCGRKPKDDVHKKKMELAKREQVDRLTKIAAPSGLLNGLNLGIINHVRNKKQVHSIIEALVRSEKLENGCLESKQAIHLKSGTKETNNMSDSGIQRLGFSHGDGSSTSLIGSKQTSGCSMSNGQGDFNIVGTEHARNFVSYSAVSKDDVLALKLSSSTNALEESRTVLNEESANSTSVSCLSVRGEYLIFVSEGINNLIYAHLYVKLSWYRNCKTLNELYILGLSIFGPVRFWTKINNQTDFILFLVLEPNRTENRLKLINFGSVFSPSKPVQTEIFILASIFQKINSNFRFVLLVQKLNPTKKYTKPKDLTAKKQRKNQKLLKCKIIKKHGGEEYRFER
jgi:hypothetical protein